MPIPRTALEGIRVLDLGRQHAAPRAGQILARLGAEVIKVEAREGEYTRRGRLVRGQSVYWVQMNSSKKSIALDLRTDKGKVILRELIAISDVLMQNFRPGTMEEMGFPYEVLHDINPGIIMLNVSAYGQTGPYRNRIGFDPIGEAISGSMSLTGYPEDPPTRSGANMIDRITALHGTIGILAALREREISGEGQAIDVCLADTGFSLTEIPIVEYLETGVEAKRTGNTLPGSLMNIYKTKDGWVYLMAGQERIFHRLCECIGKTEWVNDSRFAERDARVQNLSVIEKELADWLSTRTAEEAESILADAGVPCNTVNDISQAARSPQLWERELLVNVPDPILGTTYASGKYIKFSRSENIVGPAPGIGEHTEEILGGLLHYTPDQIRQLREEKVI